MLPSTPVCQGAVDYRYTNTYTILHQVSIKYELYPMNFEFLVSDPHREHAWSHLHYIAESVYHM